MNIVISYDGVDITDDVLITGAVFGSQVNGTPGTCQFQVKDPLRDKVFVTGKEITLDINGDRVWLGFITAVKRVYAFDAQDASDLSDFTRLISIEGVDINVLFRRRYLLKKAHPTTLEGPVYPVATPDTTVIGDMVADWLDLSSDGLDTSSLVTNVGNVNVDQKAQPFAGGMVWSEAMTTIARITGAVYYLSPARKLVYVDVDTPTAPHPLSDTPSGSEVGYRTMDILNDATEMVNDVLAIGAGGGSPIPVGIRQEDATSIATHGRWQMGTLRQGIYKQASINKVADTIINGSPLSHRGHKDDHISVQVTIFEPGFMPAQKVSFTSDVFGYSDVLPIRRMEITFPTPTDARYRLTLSHEIDLPFDPFDPVRFKFPGFGFPPFPGWHIPDENCVPSGGGSISSGGCSSLDLTNWSESLSGDASAVTHGVGVAHGDFGGGLRDGTIVLDGDYLVGSPIGEITTTPFTISYDFETNVIPDTFGGINARRIRFQLDMTSPDDPNFRRFGVVMHDEPFGGSFFGSDGTIQTIELHGWAANTPYTMSVVVRDDGVVGTLMPQGVSITLPPFASIANGINPVRLTMFKSYTGAATTDVSNFKLCTPVVTGSDCGSPAVIDDFERTTDPGWGIASSGFAWDFHDNPLVPADNDAQTYESGLDGGWPGHPTEFVGSLLSSGTSPPGSAYVRSFLGETGPWQNNEWIITVRFAWEVGALAGPVVGVITDGSGQAAVQLGGSELILSSVLDTTSDTYAFSFTHDNPYYLKIHYKVGEVLEAKVWSVVDPEPTDYQVYGVPDMVVDATSYLYFGSPAPSGFQEAFEVAEILLATCASSSTADCFPASGFVCEDLAISGADYTTTGSYRHGTLEVYLSGLFQRPGVDYNEVDPATGTFSFTSTPTGTLRVCYDRVTSTGGYPLAPARLG